MPVNPTEGTSAETQLLDALGGTEQQPTEEAEGEDGQVSEAESDATDEVDDEDAELEDVADPEEGDDEADEGTERYTVKVNGEEIKVNLKELKDGYMKDADYRRKTAEVADIRKRSEAAEVEYKAGLQTLEQQLESVAGFIANQINVDDAEMDKLVAENPAEAMRVQRELGKKGTLLQQVDGHLRRVREAQAAQSRKAAEDFRNAENAKLVEAAPEMKNAENVNRLHQYLTDTYGLTKEEIGSVADHRFALIAEKARRFDAIKAKAALKDKQIKKTTTKFQKGGAVQRSSAVAAKNVEQAHKRVMATGRTDDLAKLL